MQNLVPLVQLTVHFSRRSSISADFYAEISTINCIILGLCIFHLKKECKANFRPIKYSVVTVDLPLIISKQLYFGWSLWTIERSLSTLHRFIQAIFRCDIRLKALVWRCHIYIKPFFDQSKISLDNFLQNIKKPLLVKVL